jgi:ABC-type branched-subunit amino acid transport system substrate-binding protein
VVGHFCSSTIPASEIYDEAGIIAITQAPPTHRLPNAA